MKQSKKQISTHNINRSNNKNEDKYRDTFTFGDHSPDPLMENMQFTGGYFNARELVLYNVGWTVFFIFNLFLLFAVLNSIFAESLRRTVKAKGYPEDGNITQWNIRDFLKWIIHYWPNDKTEEENNS